MNGEPDDTVWWVHGWGTSPAIWSDAASRYLPEFRHRFFTYKKCRSADDFRGAMRHILLCEPQPAAVIGWSLGGMLLLEAAFQGADESQENRAFTGNLVLTGTTLKFVNRDRLKGWPARAIERMASQLAEDSQEVLYRFRLNMLSSAEQKRFSDRFPGDETSDFSAEGLKAGLDYLKNTDLTPISGALSALSGQGHFLWIHGTDDPICPLGGATHLPEHALRILPDAGHAAFLTQPDRFYDLLRGFLHDNR